MESAEIRQRFLRFFEQRGHTVVPSAPLPLPDPTLLLVNAGMVPFKPYFLGEQTPQFRRAVSVQKCVRTLDIEEVGKTARHASFFQMAGNFSFGDYFKESAIPFAWELLTNSTGDGGFGFDESKLWVTVLTNDAEAEEIWRRDVGVSPDRIQRRGLADNYWQMGVPGPGGPSSEIYYDRGDKYGPDGGPVVDEERFLEVWNLVFMQDSLSAVRSKEDFDIAGELPAKNIDTGMGLERMATVLQSVDNLYEIDTTRRILDEAVKLTGRGYGRQHIDDVRFRIVADHARTAVMLIGDQVVPGNEGRGYVLRRIMRRVVRSMRLLGGPEHSMRELVSAAIEAMGPQYPELELERARIHSVAEAEEAAFLRTLRSGTQIFDMSATQARDRGTTTLSGASAFKLHDTFGFPIELTLEMASEQGLSVDEDGFRRLMNEQQTRAKADARSKKSGHADVAVYRDLANVSGRTTFTGYDETETESVVRGIVRDGEVVASASTGDEIELVLERTPFYAEGGGQLADAGQIKLANGAVLTVDDVQQPLEGLYVHRARVLDGDIQAGLGALGTIDVERRRSISRAHTATHMVHKAMRELLGETATQAGSENSPGRFRFDFPNSGAVPSAVLSDVEQKVNEILVDDLTVEAELMSLTEARETGAMALFGEKYGDIVRVVSVGDWTRELCGGTHANRTGQLGVVKLLGESSIGAGVRRIEALVGIDAYRFLAREHTLVHLLTEQLKAPAAELPDRVAQLVQRLRDAEKEIEQAKRAKVAASMGDVAGSGRRIGEVEYFGFQAPDTLPTDHLRELVLNTRAHAGNDRPVVVLGFSADGPKVAVVAAVNAAAEARGTAARDVLVAALPAIEGRGGGKGDVAQGGGSNPSGVAAAIAAVEAFLASR
ncbi:MAG TPA: alanine--tRNA ligase [Actinomycetes bacterium]|nr:alanine--tRNA ligase [Actinomycetes bacterium]